MYLLDTNVVSELRRGRPHGAVVGWLQTVDEAELYVSAVTIGELQAGVEITREQDAGKAAGLTRLPLLGAADAWTSDTLIEDAMIAATAAVHHLAVATRNIRHFCGLAR